jgi:hypothetical protein
MSLPIQPELLDRTPLTGKSPALSLWRKKTKNLYRGVLELNCAEAEASRISDFVLKAVEAEYKPGFWVPFAFGTVLHFKGAAPSAKELECLVDDRARNRGTWQWVIAVNQSTREAYGIHMWASGYLTPAFEAILKDLNHQGYKQTTRVKQPSKFWLNMWATTKALLTARAVLVAIGAVLGLAYLVFKAVQG